MREGAGASIKKGSVPKVSDVIDARRARAIAKVNAVAEDVSAEGSPWMTLADEILTDTQARVALASCLSLAFAGTLDPARYSQIADVERDERPGRLVDQAGQTRVFVSAGRQAGIDRKKLAEMIRRVSGLPDRLIEGIQVFDAFSLVTVPFDAAERIIRESRGRRQAPAHARGQGRRRRRGRLPRAAHASARGGQGEGQRGEEEDVTEGAARRGARRARGHAPKGSRGDVHEVFV